jgi:hypothetical protein
VSSQEMPIHCQDVLGASHANSVSCLCIHLLYAFFL